MKKTLVRSLAVAVVGSLMMAGSALALPTMNGYIGMSNPKSPGFIPESSTFTLYQ